MSIGTDSQSSSTYLSSSHSSLNHTKKASSEISKTYKHASQLYLTRRLVEAHEVLQPVIKPPPTPLRENGEHTDDEQPKPQAPIALGGTSQRIKIWSLYVTLLNSIVDLGPEEGKADFGSKEYGSIVRKVQSGDVWEQVVQDGYQGREGSVDAEVVYNLSNLLLAQAPNQKITQSRLETYLAASSHHLGLDLPAQLNHALSTNGRTPPRIISGTSTPKDLASRIKILELFILHVLPRNDEWDYARSFINGSDILDEERKEAFVQTLAELQEAKEQEDAEDEEGQETGYEDALDDFAQENHDEDDHNNNSEKGRDVSQDTNHRLSNGNSFSTKGILHQRTSSEVDYGIDYAHPNGNTGETSKMQQPQSPQKQRLTNDTPNDSKAMRSIPPNPMVEPEDTPTTITESTPSKSTQPTSTSIPSKASKAPAPPASSRPAPTSKPKSKSGKSSSSSSKATSSKNTNTNNSNNNIVIRQVRNMALLIRNLSVNLSHALTSNRSAILRTLMFIVAFLVMLSRRQIRERIREILERGWGKVRGTVGMGVKVSYI